MKELIEKKWYWVNWEYRGHQHKEYGQYMYCLHSKYHFQFGNGDWISGVRFEIKSEHEIKIYLK